MEVDSEFRMARHENYNGIITIRWSDEFKTIMNSVARIDKLKPETTDEETLNKLIDVLTEMNRFRQLKIM